MEEVRPWCGQPSDRGRLNNRTVPNKKRRLRWERFAENEGFKTAKEQNGTFGSWIGFLKKH